MPIFRTGHGPHTLAFLTMTIALATGWAATAGPVSAAELADPHHTSTLESLTIHSKLVPGPVEVAILLPPTFAQHKQPHQLLLWLHGGGGSSAYLSRELRPVVEAAWARGDLPPLVVAVPSARRSFYMDYRDGTEKWETLLLKELLPLLQSKYHLRQDREGRFIGGYSMGGMGSLRIVFKHPDRFAAVAAIAPAIEPVFRFDAIHPFDRAYRNNGIYETVYGDPVDQAYWQANHPPAIARDRIQVLADSGLKIYFEVGDADSLGLYRGGEFLHRLLLKGNVRHEYRLVHGADHEDNTLPARLADAVRFLGRTLQAQQALDDLHERAKKEVTAHMQRYTKLFNEEQSEAIATEIYEAPVLLPRPLDELPAIAQTPRALQELYTNIFQSVRSKGWKRSVVHDMHVHLAGTHMAFVEITFSRLRANGEAIPPERRIATYIASKRETGWRLIFASSQPEPPSAAAQQITRDVKMAMHRYLELLNREQPSDIAREIYQTPMMIRGLKDKHRLILMTAAEAGKRLTGILQTLKTNGWSRFVNHGMHVRIAGTRLALVNMTSSRVLADGTAMPPSRTPFSYVWIKRTSGWRMIAVLAQTQPD